MHDLPRGGSGSSPLVAEVNCAFVAAWTGSRPPAAPAVAAVCHSPAPPCSQPSACPSARSPVSGPSQGALAGCQVCLSAEAGISSRHCSESAGWRGEALLPPWQLPELKPSAPSRACLASQTRPCPTWPEEARSVALSVLTLRCDWEGLLSPGPDESPWD